MYEIIVRETESAGALATIELTQQSKGSQQVLLEAQPPVRLLLIDDNKIILKILEFLLVENGYVCDVASSGEEAWSLVQEYEYDLIITDVGLPGMSGTEFSQRVRTHEGNLHKLPTPIIGLTGYEQGRAREKCINSGMNEVFTKPVEHEVLGRCIEKLVAKNKGWF